MRLQYKEKAFLVVPDYEVAWVMNKVVWIMSVRGLSLLWVRTWNQDVQRDMQYDSIFSWSNLDYI